MSVVDVGPVNLTGAVRGQRVRIVWSDGTLHVVRGRDQITRHVTSEPVQEGENWRMSTPDGKTVFATKRGCSCGYNLGGVPQSNILNTATPAE